MDEGHTSEQLEQQHSQTTKVLTYHCAFCSHLLLATTFPLSTLPRRRSPPALDRALILPLPKPPSSETADSDSDDESAQGRKEGRDGGKDVTLLLCTKDAKMRIIEREDGFEKRIGWRCGRCKVAVGYQLDSAHYDTTTTATVGDGTDRGGGGREGKRIDVIYILPGALVATEELGTAVPVPEIMDDWK